MTVDQVAGSGRPLEPVLELVRSRIAAGEREAVEAFVRQYFAQVDAEDLEERAPADLYGAALSHWGFARRRESGRPRIRVFDPTIEEHGWQSPHTVVEIVNDDMPFLVDSVAMEVNRQGLTLHLVIHPILSVVRGADGRLAGLAAEGAQRVTRESLMHLEVDRVGGAARAQALAEGIARVLGDVRVAVGDWQPMRARVQAILEELERHPPPSIAAAELEEGKAFLHWLSANHFTFLGYRCHDLVRVQGEDALRIVPGSSLGILRDGDAKAVAASFSALPPEVRAYARRRELLIVTKANSRSTVHRPGYLDYVGVKRFDADGEVCGEHRFLGLYTSTAYSASVSEIPVVRHKAAHVRARAGLPPGSHADKALRNVLETYPRDELFQVGEDELLVHALGIVRLGNRQRFRLFLRRDPFERFVSCLVYAPRENYTTELRVKWQRLLEQALGGSGSEFNVYLSESVLARVLIVVRTRPGSIPPVDARELEARLAEVSRRWEDELRQALVAAVGEATGIERHGRFASAFPAAYREDYAARQAVPDIGIMAALTPEVPLGLSLYRPIEAAPGALRFKLFHLGDPVALSDGLPMLERMGLRVLEERPYRVAPAGGPPVWIHDFGLIAPTPEIEPQTLHPVFEDAFARVFRGEVENDDFNRLVVAAGLSAREVVVLRAYGHYLRQLGFPLSQSFVQATLANHPGIARALVELFTLRLEPGPATREAEAERTRAAQIEAALDGVANLSEDRVLREILALVLATTRTNFWRRDASGAERPFLSFKLDPAKVPGMPEPRPMFEIFVYSPRFEGVHMRGGKVARGGLRWSDRPEDFRTEILGLVKAQMVKNIVIVPVGSKGGFVLKRAPAPSNREAWMAEGIACYQDYLRGLLDLTDNLVGGKVVAPPSVRRRDADDPYLVVAADKGTASFSDHANAISREYGFWLGDAFASGGSAGYDHKAMGITARGAWESVKRHFREMGVDTQSTDFTAVGIGDMSGDVFGNGMLRSRHVRLVAAFDHRHVFLDPNPDPGRGFEERARLYALPRSSWADYDAGLISAGGGVFPRTAKAIPISPEARAALGIEGEAEALSPAALITAILEAPVDLLYNGGIGTYVKASTETHAEVGDRANDAVRVDGRALRCKVVGEGGNLGFTQRGRIEYALAGGRIFTDAIDNSGGVATSDREVNIKILLGLAMADGELTEKQRNALLSEMTDEVAALVLRDNYFQTQALSAAGRIAPKLLDGEARFIRYLERAGRLNRAIEFLPSEEDIAQRRAQGKGLASPERAVLFAYAKMWLYDELLASPLPDDPWVATALARYFPAPLRERYAAYMPRHPLGREIIATHVTNSMVNRVGATFVHRTLEVTGAKPHEVVRAFLLARECFGLVDLWKGVEALDNVVADAVQAQMLLTASRLVARATTWFLRSRRLTEEMGATIEHFAPRVRAVTEGLAGLLDPAERARFDAAARGLVAQGVPAALAARVAGLDALHGAPDMVEVAGTAKVPVETVAAVYFDVATRLEMPWLRERIAELPADEHWEGLARGAMFDDLAGLQRAVATEVLAGAGPGEAARAEGGAPDPVALMTAWRGRNQRALDRAAALLAELRASPAVDAAMLSVALRELRSLG